MPVQSSFPWGSLRRHDVGMTLARIGGPQLPKASPVLPRRATPPKSLARNRLPTAARVAGFPLRPPGGAGVADRSRRRRARPSRHSRRR